ncbi:single-stranded DNA-binding protein [Syntrophomonas palmitatica]|uniref:single-stranded DNA-binding protein n=1 Tax=Syntrophomonas palmitatica TaxID=402877 RepID=UPI0006CF89DE|nr:single-stranded DNA-binding protein [Syntrophomonas palmitatica]
MNRNCGAFVKIVKIPLKQGEKGAKAEVLMQGDIKAFLRVPYDGELAKKVAESANKCLPLVGVFRNIKNVTLPVFEAVSLLTDTCVFVGRLTRDAEFAYSANGKAFTRFGLAVNYGWGDQKETDFWDCTVFGNDKEKNKATAMAEQGTKGRLIAVTGRLSQNTKDGKTYTSLIVDEFEFLDKKNGKGDTKNGKENTETPEYGDWSDYGTETQEEYDF